MAKFAEGFGVHNLWRRDLNFLADSLAGEWAIEAKSGACYRCILEVDRLAFDINHHLACVAKIKPILLRASMRLRLLGRQALTRSLDF